MQKLSHRESNITLINNNSSTYKRVWNIKQAKWPEHYCSQIFAAPLSEGFIFLPTWAHYVLSKMK